MLSLRSPKKKNFSVTMKVNFGTFYCYLFLDFIDILVIFSVNSYDEDKELSLGQAIQDVWRKRKSSSVTGWVLSVLPGIWSHVSSELAVEHCLIIERVVKQLHHPPYPNDQVPG